jgi:arabinofuranan 3-O-arabinosyltransferase
VVAESSSRAFNSPDVRASQALDGDSGTAWIPEGSAVLPSLSVTAPPQQIDHVDIRQTGAGGSRPSTFASRVRIEIDGRVVRDADLTPGLTRVRIPEVVAGRLRLTILDVTRTSQAEPVRIAEVGFGSARIDKTGAATGCTPVATIDGRPMMMRPEHPIHSATPAPWLGCTGHVELTGSRHALRPDDGWVLDRLNLLDASAHPAVRAATPNISVHDRRGPAYDITTGPTDSPFVLMLGEGYDARWRATVDGRSLGSPIVLDGYATGWVLPAGEHHIEVRYGPQRWTDLALLVSLTTLLGCLVFFVRGRKRSATPREPLVAAVDRLAGRRKLPVVAGWVLATIGSYVLGGAWLAVPCAALAVCCLTRRPPSGRTLLLAAAAVMASVPVIFLVSTTSMWGQVTAALIVGHPWPHRAAAMALLLLVVGVLRDEAGRSDTLGTDD